MKAKLLDTNVLIDLTRGRSEHLTTRFSEEIGRRTPMVVSTVSIYEFRYGAERSQRRDNQLAGLNRFLTAMQVVEFDAADAEAAALVKAGLAARGQMIGAYDLLLAAQGLARDLVVVTGDTREFARVPGLALEDWSQSA